MAKVAFELKDSVEDFDGATASLRDGELFDAAEALSNGGGKIVLDPEPQFTDKMDEEARQEEYDRAVLDEQKIEALDALEVFKRTTVGEKSEAKSGGSSARKSEGGAS